MIITGYKQMDGVIINNVTGRSSFFISRQLPVSRKLRLLSQELANVRRVTVIRRCAMADEIVLSQEIETGISQKVDPVELAKNIYPRIERALQLAVTPQETNEIRAQLETVNTYIQRSIPKVIKDRTAQFYYTHEGDMLYLRASEKSGALWKVCEEKRPQGTNQSSENFQKTMSATDAGFKNPRDAISCERISELHEEDWRTYEQETKLDMRQATMNGLENIWRMLNKAELISLPTDKYRIVYADPPWKYGNTMPDNMGVQDDHYQLLDIDELCNLEVVNIVEDNAVLFIWATSPILEEAFKVIKAWGFEYKSSFVWDKEKHVMGHFNSVRHEFLLVCTRGSCQPDVMKLFDSVYTEARTAHSSKPEYFRNVINTIYPYGNRIELFARDEHDNWEAWGNEIPERSTH